MLDEFIHVCRISYANSQILNWHWVPLCMLKWMHLTDLGSGFLKPFEKNVILVQSSPIHLCSAYETEGCKAGGEGGGTMPGAVGARAGARVDFLITHLLPTAKTGRPLAGPHHHHPLQVLAGQPLLQKLRQDLAHRTGLHRSLLMTGPVLAMPGKEEGSVGEPHI